MKHMPENLLFKEFSWSRPFSQDQVEQVIHHLFTLQPRNNIIFELRGFDHSVHYYLGTDKQDFSKIEAAFNSYGSQDFSDSFAFNAPERQAILWSRKLSTHRSKFPLRTDSIEAITQAILAILSQQDKEQLVIQLILGGSYAPIQVPKEISDPHTPLFKTIIGDIPKASTETRAMIQEKMRTHRVGCVVRFGSSAKSPVRAIKQFEALLSAFRKMEQPNLHLKLLNDKPEKFNLAAAPWQMPLQVNVKECAGLFFLPTGEEIDYPGVPPIHPRLLLPPTWMVDPPEQKQRSFGTTLNQNLNSRRRLNISPLDACRHTWCLGPAGVGKTNALLLQIMSDIEARRPVLICEPNSDLTNDICRRIPKDRIQDVIYLDPCDPEAVVGFNPLALAKEVDPTLIAEAILSIFKGVFKDNFGVFSQDLITSGLLTLAANDDVTLLHLPLLFTDARYRRQQLKKVTNLELLHFWAQWEDLSENEQRQQLRPVLNKLRQFSLREGLKNCLAQKQPKWSLTDFFKTGRSPIILIPLNKGVLGAEAVSLLGAMIISMTWILCLNRGKVPIEQRQICCTYLDEAQNFLHLPLEISEVLAQSRKFRMAVHIANQYRNQMPPDLRAGLDTNAQNKILFQLNSSDAKDFQSIIAPELQAVDLRKIPPYSVYCNLLVNGKPTGWISGVTDPPTPEITDLETVKAESRKRYGMPVSEINEMMKETFGFPGVSTDLPMEKNKTEIKIGRRKQAES